mgnify:CR=1 FL=1
MNKNILIASGVVLIVATPVAVAVFIFTPAGIVLLGAVATLGSSVLGLLGVTTASAGVTTAVGATLGATGVGLVGAGYYGLYKTAAKVVTSDFIVNDQVNRAAASNNTIF